MLKGSSPPRSRSLLLPMKSASAGIKLSDHNTPSSLRPSSRDSLRERLSSALAYRASRAPELSKVPKLSSSFRPVDSIGPDGVVSWLAPPFAWGYFLATSLHVALRGPTQPSR